MAHGTRINGTVYGVTGGKCLVGGTEYGIKKGRTLIGGTGYDVVFATLLSSYAEGDIVYINERSSPIEFYIAKHDYESELNGPGRTLVVRKDIYDEMAWDSDDRGNWDRCTLLSWLNSTYKSLLDGNIQSLIGSTTYKYTEYYGKEVATRADSVFLMSLTEFGLRSSNGNTEGSELPIAGKIKIANFEGAAISQWTRTIRTNYNGLVLFVNSRGENSQGWPNLEIGVRPIFTLPGSTIVGENGIIL